jgi:hypothetical protein
MIMAKIENEIQYNWAVKNMVAGYSEKHFSLGEPALADVIKLCPPEINFSQSYKKGMRR